MRADAQRNRTRILAAAEEVLRNGYRQLEEMGGTGPRVNVATLLARVVLLRGRNDDVEEITRTCERLAAADQAGAAHHTDGEDDQHDPDPAPHHVPR